MKTRGLKYLKYVYLSLSLMLLFTKPVYAYIDPSVMTYAIQAVAGIAISLSAFLGILYRKLRKKFFKTNTSNYKIWESDDLYFCDPTQNGKKITPVINRSRILNKEDTRENKKGLRDYMKIFIQEMIPGILLSAATSFMLCFYAPLEIYMNNKNEFWFDYQLMKPELIHLTVTVFFVLLVLLIISYILYNRFYHTLLAGGMIAFISTYIQGNYLVSHMPPMDGTTIKWQEYYPDMKQSLLLWVVVIILVVLFIRFFKMEMFYKLSDFVCILVSMMLAVSLISINIKKNGTEEKNNTYIVTNMNKFKMSDNHNFLIILVDAVDAKAVTDIFDEDSKYKEYFTDFTYFPDTLSGYPFTSRSIPFILTGEWYENQEDYLAFETRAMDNSPLIKTLEQENYELNMYTSEVFYNSNNIFKFKNIIPVEMRFTSSKAFQMKALKLVMYKYFPYFLKKYVQTDSSEFQELQYAGDENQGTVDEEGCNDYIYSWSEKCMYNATHQKKIEHVTENTFHFLHLSGAHVPFNLDENVNRIDESEGTYFKKTKAAMEVVKEYLNLLKEENVYDNTAIIIMADHGYNYDVERNGLEVRRQNALLMVKGFNEKHELQISEAPISHADLQDAYKKLLNGNDSQNIFSYKDGDERIRRFLMYNYTKENYIVEYETKGHASDINALYKTGNEYVLNE